MTYTFDTKSDLSITLPISYCNGFSCQSMSQNLFNRSFLLTTYPQNISKSMKNDLLIAL